jgi:hypothetical protein
MSKFSAPPLHRQPWRLKRRLAPSRLSRPALTPWPWDLTGLSYATALLAGKILDLLREISHPTRPVVALWYGPNAASAAQLQEL